MNEVYTRTLLAGQTSSDEFGNQGYTFNADIDLLLLVIANALHQHKGASQCGTNLGADKISHSLL